LADKIARLQALIKSTEELLVRLRESLEFHQTELADDEAALAAMRAWCAEQSSVYMTETDERNRELDILDRLAAHL